MSEQWLIHDLCEAIEALKVELDRLKNCRHECKIVCLLDEYNKKCTELEKVKSELMELRIAWDMYGGAENITGAFAELEKVKDERDRFEQMYLQSEADATNLTGELAEVSAENARLRREREADT